MTDFVRGSAITFRATCKDMLGAPVTPDEATLIISYVRDGARVSDSIGMDIAGDTVSTVWDSSVAADTMPVIWHIRAAGCAKDGSFVLSASAANPSV